jgi:cbb3-type cytochrome c oxidase subunit II
MQDPRAVVPQSIMPAYAWIYDAKVEIGVVADKMRVLKRLGTPYTADQVAAAGDDYRAQAATVVANLAAQGKTGADPDSEIVALIGYLMRLGRNLEPARAPTQVIESGR